VKSKAQRDRKAAVRARNEATCLEQEIRAFPEPTNPKQATAKSHLAFTGSPVRGASP
jgi:hypothetical protein